MSFSFCLNKHELLLLSGFGLLFQNLNLNRKGKLMQDSQRLVCSVVAILERNAAFGSAEFKKVACTMMSIDDSAKPAQAVKAGSNPRKKSDVTMEAPSVKVKTGRKQLQAMASRFSTGNIYTIKKEGTSGRRATAPAGSTKPPAVTHSSSQPSVHSTVHEPIQPQASEQTSNRNLPLAAGNLDVPNLDYLSFGEDNSPTPSYPNTGGGNATKGVMTDEFTGCLGSPPLGAPFDSFLSSADALGSYMASSPLTSQFDWGPDLWTLPTETGNQETAKSVPSTTEEELTSGEEWSIHDSGSEHRGIAMPHAHNLGLEALDANFGV